MEDFLEPARKAGAGLHLKNIYNDYVYFWRWALWRLFEKQDCGGIVSFITASSYLAGPGFVGMREVMRQNFDELWIIDLGGDNLGTRKTPNVFAIQTPVAIAVGVKSKTGKKTPAKVWYTKIRSDTRDGKLDKIAKTQNLTDIKWRPCADGWGDPFLPIGTGDYFDWPEIINIFPWQHSGTQFKRTWTIGESKGVLISRWNALKTEQNPKDANKLFRQTGSRNFTKTVTGIFGDKLKSIANMTSKDFMASVLPYAYRSFDRHWAVLDTRFADRIRPELLRANGKKQTYFSTLFSRAMGHGPALTASANVPDLDHFRGSFGGKATIPLYRDADATQPNITGGLLDALGAAYGTTPTPENLASYVYAVLGGQSYTSRFWNELETPGPRVPITKNGKLFAKTAKLGRRLIWLHTYAERFGDGQDNEVPGGTAKSIKGISSEPSHYPEDYTYDPDTKEIRVGDGVFGPVSAEVWAFEVSGLKVVKSWLGYRMKKRSGKKSSPLDDIRPERWSPKMSDEFLELLWVLEATLNMEPQLSSVLDEIVEGNCFNAEKLPTPTEQERKPPKANPKKTRPKSGDQVDMFS